MAGVIRTGWLFRRMVATCLLAAVAGTSLAQTAGMTPPSALVVALRDGGLIIYLRHASTNHDEADRNISDLSRCELQRNLSEQGRAESRLLREAFESFDIPIGRVFASPYCRTVETAMIAFGGHEVVHDLRAVFFTSEEETKRINATLRDLLSRVPEPGNGNTVIVGHAASLSEVADVWPKPEGVTHVFRPLGGSGFAHLGRIPPTDWAAMLEAQ